MEKFVKRDICVVTYPYSDGFGEKRRPALVIGVSREDVMLCRMSATAKSGHKITNSDFELGRMNKKEAYIQHDKINTANKDRIKYKIGTLKPETYKEVIKQIIKQYPEM